MNPDFLIIGAQKSGTTSLYNYLIQHPQILPASQKEIHYFDLNYNQGINWYKAQFPQKISQNIITGESSPYYLFHPCVPQRVHEHFPQIKLIILLREPVARTWSHYHHEVRLKFEKLSFEEAIANETERLKGETEKLLADDNYYSFNHQHYSYLARGIYHQQIKKWQQYFPKNQILILKSEDFYNNPEKILNQTLEFLQLDPHPIKNYSKYNAGEYPEISETTKQYLINYFQPHNQKLSQDLGITFW
ncbi:MAG TPA: sulfotransferase [Halomicronema sp.]